MKKRSAFRDVGDEDLAKSYFEAYINMLKEKLGENLGEEEEAVSLELKTFPLGSCSPKSATRPFCS